MVIPAGDVTIVAVLPMHHIENLKKNDLCTGDKMWDDYETTLETIGRRYNIPPQLIYQTIKPAAIVTAQKDEKNDRLPESPQPGTGNLTLADFCTQFNLNMKLVVRELKKQGIDASEELTLKKIAAQSNTSPIDVYERIRNIVQN